MSLTEYLKRQNAAVAYSAAAKVREYHAHLGDLPQRLQTALVEVEKIAPSLLKFIEQKERQYPQSPNLPPALHAQIHQLHADFLQPGRERLNTLAPRIGAFLERIQSAKPEDFHSFAPATIARCDGERAGGLLSEVRWLAELPESIKPLEAEIHRLMEVFRDRPYAPEPKLSVNVQKHSDEGTESEWDPRAI